VRWFNAAMDPDLSAMMMSHLWLIAASMLAFQAPV
jgi:hypothetical protein